MIGHTHDIFFCWFRFVVVVSEWHLVDVARRLHRRSTEYPIPAKACCWVLIMNDGLLHRNTSLLCQESAEDGVLPTLTKGNVLHTVSDVGSSSAEPGRGWSCWRSPAETLSINGPLRPSFFSYSIFLLILFYFSMCFFRSHPRRKRKSNKKDILPSHRRMEGGGGRIREREKGNIEKFLLFRFIFPQPEEETGIWE